MITQESWEKICQLQWSSTGSNTWREFCFKNISRYFITPIQKRYQGSGEACWRLCGANGANHFHIFWDCPIIRTYWKEIHKHIVNVFHVNIPFNCETVYLGNLPVEAWNTKDKKLLAILLAASKKSVTRKWLRIEPPTIEEWTGIIYEIYIMEKISFSLKVDKEKFYKIWTKWTEYVKPIRSDFI